MTGPDVFPHPTRHEARGEFNVTAGFGQDPIMFRPVRTEPRGDFPAHGTDPAQHVLTGPEAAELALRRLGEWIRDHADTDPAGVDDGNVV